MISSAAKPVAIPADTGFAVFFEGRLVLQIDLVHGSVFYSGHPVRLALLHPAVRGRFQEISTEADLALTILRDNRCTEGVSAALQGAGFEVLPVPRAARPPIPRSRGG